MPVPNVQFNPQQASMALPWSGICTRSAIVHERWWRGVAIHVKVAEGVRRELYLEYPAVQTQKISFTRRILSSRISLEQKWSSHPQAMRGLGSRFARKPYVYEVDELPG